MNLEKFTIKAQEALQEAQNTAVKFGHQEISLEHLFASLLSKEGLVSTILRKSGVNIDVLKSELDKEIQKKPSVSGSSQVYISNKLNKCLIKAKEEADRLKDDFVSVEHLLLALIVDSSLSGFLRNHNVTHDKVLNAMNSVRGNQRASTQNPEGTYQALERYGRDLVEEAKKGKLDPVIGRDTEIRRIIRILSRKTKIILC